MSEPAVDPKRQPRLRSVEGVDRIDALYAADRWLAASLGIPAQRHQGAVDFAGISQPWLREALKRWARQRLATGTAFGTINTAMSSFRGLSRFLAACSPVVGRPQDLDRVVVERYLAWLTQRELSAATKHCAVAFLRGFLEDNRRYQWLEGVPPDAIVYHDEGAIQRASLPRFISEFVMAQIEAETNLAQLARCYRNLVVLLTETGLRSGDACSLAFDPLAADSTGWPCLRFWNRKMRAEQFVPLSAPAAEAVRAQQRHVGDTWPGGSPWLFPSASDPALPQSYSSFRRAFSRWQERIGLHDEAGRAVHVSPHQLRHTLGTRLINAGVPQHVIQRLLGHASPVMTAVYARLHDSTLRAEFDRYCQSRVDIGGRMLGFDPGAATADAEWAKHNLARAADTLPNGYCGRPPQQDCPHPNACLTCPDFQTTVEFLHVHRHQAETTRALIETAEAAGRQRQAANHRQVLTNLEKIIPALEALDHDDR